MYKHITTIATTIAVMNSSDALLVSTPTEQPFASSNTFELTAAEQANVDKVIAAIEVPNTDSSATVMSFALSPNEHATLVNNNSLKSIQLISSSSTEGESIAAPESLQALPEDPTAESLYEHLAKHKGNIEEIVFVCGSTGRVGESLGQYIPGLAEIGSSSNTLIILMARHYSIVSSPRLSENIKHVKALDQHWADIIKVTMGISTMAKYSLIWCVNTPNAVTTSNNMLSELLVIGNWSLIVAIVSTYKPGVIRYGLNRHILPTMAHANDYHEHHQTLDVVNDAVLRNKVETVIIIECGTITGPKRVSGGNNLIEFERPTVAHTLVSRFLGPFLPNTAKPADLARVILSSFVVSRETRVLFVRYKDLKAISGHFVKIHGIDKRAFSRFRGSKIGEFFFRGF
ncbi:hypothetical protein BON22_0593 [Cyberlindnera fabianii]|uniref:Uncharacterized protein n=1 Tax=Cyberlindnera fabianii TaxID=36022 RepID=A0A1V2LEI6_CYBFA|nr:hypothetical protein BON22_0593 [Cyberlindnera fabianii]